MNNKENAAIVKIRNEVSLRVDDLVAEVVNGVLAQELRLFSEEIMELTPGFGLTMKQAAELKKLTEKTLKQYTSHQIRDEELLNYRDNARSIIRGQKSTNGGMTMAFNINNLFNRKKIDPMEETEQKYEEVCKKISRCEQEITHCIESSKDLDPKSMEYRNYERKYLEAKDKLTLLTKQEKQIGQALIEANRISTIQKYKQEMDNIDKLIGKMLGKEDSVNKAAAYAEVREEIVEQKLNRFDNIGGSLFETSGEEEKAQTDNEFGAQVAAAARRSSTLEYAGVSEKEMKEASADAESEFARMVRGESRKDEA